MKRSEAVALLVEAASSLEPVNLLTDPYPQQNLSRAYDGALAVWKETESVLQQGERRDLRIASLAVKQVRDRLLENARLYETDNKAIRDAAAKFRAIASSIAPQEQRTPQMQHSALGLRMNSLQELADARPFVELPARKTAVVEAASDEEAEDIEYIKALNALRAKLPNKIPAGQSYVICRMPIVVTTGRPLNKVKLDLTGLKWRPFYHRTARREVNVMNKKLSRESANTFVFENQLVVGMRRGETEDAPARKKEAFSKGPSVIGRKSRIIPGAARLATQAASNRFGPVVNGLSSASNKYFRSPGNPLEFMWLVPEHVIGEIDGIAVKAVAFPWLAPESHEQRETRAEDARKELRSLEEQWAILIKKKLSPSKELMDRISELRNLLHETEAKKEPSPQDRANKLASLKEKLETEVREKFASHYKQLSLVQAAIKEETDPKTINKLRREAKLLEKLIADGREMIASRLRRIGR